LRQFGQYTGVLSSEGFVHSDSEPELGVGNGLVIAVQRSQLIGSQLPKSVEWLDSRECVNTEKVRLSGALVHQACEEMCEHRLIKQAGVKPQDDMFVGRRRQLTILIVQRLQDAPSIQSARSGFFQKDRPGIEGLFVGPTGTPGTVIQYVAPDEHFTVQPGFHQTFSCAVPICYVKCFDHRSFLLPNIWVRGARNHLSEKPTRIFTSLSTHWLAFLDEISGIRLLDQ